MLLLVVCAFVALCGCAQSRTWVRQDRAGQVAGEASPQDIDTSLLLIGDGGMPLLSEPEPVLMALAAQAARLPERTLVAFLGDNVYPKGLPPAGHATRARSERRLQAQIDAVAPTGARVVFIPGNHDYARDGWAGLQRQRAYIESLGDPRVEALPAGGCPGPQVIDIGQRARLVFLDTQWWFQDGDKPRDPTSSCPEDSEAEVLAALQRALDAAGERRVVVLGHHPLASHGHHGGFFAWQDHLFPLRAAHRWAWLPLPGVGSLYPLSRRLGIAEQDLSSGTYRHLRDRLVEVLSQRPPLVYAAGHEHNLQLLQGAAARLLVVSGSGSVLRPDRVSRGDDTLLASPHAGFVRLDLLRDGRARVEVFTVHRDGRVERPLAMWLAP